MRLGFLIQTDTLERQTIQLIRALTNNNHAVFIIINDDKDRQEAFYNFSTSRLIHIEQDLPYANIGDLSLSYFYLHMMKKGIEQYRIDYFISLDPRMVPLKNDEEMISFFEKYYPQNFYIIDKEKPDPKRINRYYPFTNFKSFSTNAFVQNYSKATAFILNTLGIRRRLNFEVLQGLPYFAISNEGAKLLIQDIRFITDYFKLSWFCEKTGLITLFDKHLKDTQNDTQIFDFKDNNTLDNSSKDNILFGGIYSEKEAKLAINKYKKES
ncbi:MAG: beta-1,6-N-acetylglucosaminyltransferase [Bacillota bacterium]|jgi:hypothetical protein|nr:beta-1,6-N-acetylglucosaminyltransferase [Bacillota bacterium]NLP22466.1 hypothetical protein [Erysipelotrichaceae bacterium]